MYGRSGDDRDRSLRPLTVLASLLLAVAAAGCTQDQPEQAQPQVRLEVLDSILVELGGTPTVDLERGQRWRMISSIGTGLPPSSFRAEDLPEPRSRGAGLLQVYCIQCHWVPAPQMHAASEWPQLMRSMLLRARTLESRLGGPLTEGLVGEVLLAGLETANVPSDEQVDTMLAYLQKHALEAAGPDEIGTGPEADLFREKCANCHQAPSPKAHTAAGWQQVVKRMQANMAAMGVEPLSSEELDRIVAFLRARAAG